jgi:formate hydrogenlyase subunit 3/multisubunit Na+/H+ antiporter MnhD subunit
MDAPVFLGMIAIPLAASPLIYLAGRLAGEDRTTPVAQWLAVAALALAWIPFAQAARSPMPATATLGTISLTLDGLGLLLAAVALGLGLMVALFSGSYLRAEIGQEKFFAMLVAMVGVMIGLGVAADLFNLWIWFEAMAVCSYLLVTFHREQPAALEAGVKYLVQSAAGSVMVLIGIALVFAETGTLDLAEIALRIPQGVQSVATASPALLAAGALFVIGFGVKTALVPLHTWLPDAHSMAPSGISAMLSGVVIEAGLVAMLRSVGALSGATPIWGAVLLALGAVNMLVGNLMALRQTQVKRLLAHRVCRMSATCSLASAWRRWPAAPWAARVECSTW